ncbi:MAG: hypothetical protein QOE63_1874 [Acidimicrobiaceae bacterium]|jgi:hypothetical protein
MPTPLPSDDAAKQTPPDAIEVDAIARGVVTAAAPTGGATPLQIALIDAITDSMTGITVSVADLPPIAAGDLASALAGRDAAFRRRIVQLMLLAELVLVPLPPVVADRVEAYAAELGVGDDLLHMTNRLAHGSLGLAMMDFQRAGYDAAWDPSRSNALHTKGALDAAWQECTHDADLAARWAALEGCPDDSLGLDVWRFYRSRGFHFPGAPGSASPLLAQHDWVHVLAGYGTRVESEIEVFGFIGRANDDPRGFSLLAMVIGLFETGYLPSAAGLFAYDRGHLSGLDGMAARLADAMRRGAVSGAATGGPDLLAVDWFAHADQPLDEARAEFGVGAKSEHALAAGSVGPFDAGSMSPFQLEAGAALAVADGRDRLLWGASV